MLKRLVSLLLILCLLLSPELIIPAAAAGIPATTETHTLITTERTFNGTASTILDASGKTGELFSRNVEFTTEFRTANAGYQSLFYLGTDSTNFTYAAQNYIVLYLNAGNRIGVEMKGIQGGYVHFYRDLPAAYNDNLWHTLTLRIVDRTSVRFVIDGVEYAPTFATNSAGMPNETATKFVPDAAFDVRILNIGGARRASSSEWLFNGSMRNTSFKVTTDAKAYAEKHTLLTSERTFNATASTMLNASDKIGALQSRNVEFTTDFKTSNTAYQSLFYVGADTTDFTYASQNYIVMYMNSGNRIGVEMKGIQGGYVHFYRDLPASYANGQWHTLTLRIVNGTSVRFVVDGVEYAPVFATNSAGMPNETATKFVPDASFNASVLTIGGAQRATSVQWLFNGSMRNTSFTTDAYIDGTPAPNVKYENMNFTGIGKGKNISGDLDYIKSLSKGTLSFRLRRAEAGTTAVQHLLTVGNSASTSSYSTIYIAGNTIGYDFRNGSSTVASGSQAAADFANDTNWYTVTMTFDGTNVTVYVNDKKAFTLPCAAFLNKTLDANHISIGRSNTAQLPFNGYIDSFTVYDRVLSESFITQTLNNATVTQQVQTTTVPRPLPPSADTYRTPQDYRMFASVSASTLKNPSLVGDPAIMGDAQGFRIPSLLRAVTPSTTDKDALIAFTDKGNEGADWGNVDIATRRSVDNGATWSNKVDTILSLPPHDAPQGFHDWGSAFYIDALTAQATNGDVVMMVDMWPESKGLHQSGWLESGTGYTNINGKYYLVLYDGDSKVGDGTITSLGNMYTVRENGWVYNSSNQRTNYYIPPVHSAQFNYETMGDMYYVVEQPDYLTVAPPLVPQNPAGKPEGSNDVYVGNIYLSYNKPAFNPTNPVFVAKRLVGSNQPGALYSKYTDYETDPAPLRATVTSYLWVSRSSDFGQTWSQPIDITPQVKIASDGAFLGTGPGTGTVLKHQSDPSKQGRIVMPTYALGKAAALYSDDHGFTWKRANNNGYMNNIDEVQIIELFDGTLVSFGRQGGKGPTPVSVSKDGGTTWGPQTTEDLISVTAQKSVITYPIDSATSSDETSDPRFDYPAGMQKGKQYVLSSHPTGNSVTDGSRTYGVVNLGEVQEDGNILWIAERSLKIEPNQYANTGGYENFFAYSSLAVLENGNIGILFEPQPNNYLAYAEFNLEWILNGAQPGRIMEPNMTTTQVQAVGQPELTGMTMSIHKGTDTSSGIAAGDTLVITASHTENVFVSVQPALTLNINGRSVDAIYSGGSGSKQLSFSYVVKAGDVSSSGTTVSALTSYKLTNGAFVVGVRNETVINRLPSSVTLYPSP